MKKKIRDISFKEINTWANKKECIGQYSQKSALTVIICIQMVNKHRFRKEKHWEKIKTQYLNLEAEIEVEDE